MLKYSSLSLALFTCTSSFGCDLRISPGSALIGYRCLKQNEQIRNGAPDSAYQALIIRPTPNGWWVNRIVKYPCIDNNSPCHISYQSFEYADDEKLSKTFSQNSTSPVRAITPVLDTQRYQYETARLTTNSDVCDYQSTIHNMFTAWQRHEHNKQQSPLKIYIAPSEET